MGGNVLAKSTVVSRKYASAKIILEDIVASGGYLELVDKYDNYRAVTNNNESIFEVQYSVNDRRRFLAVVTNVGTIHMLVVH
jgi:hypothetical protein